MSRIATRTMRRTSHTGHSHGTSLSASPPPQPPPPERRNRPQLARVAVQPATKGTPMRGILAWLIGIPIPIIIILYFLDVF